MSRPKPPSRFDHRRLDDWLEHRLHIKTITPMIGGGHTAGRIDRLQPWRASEVKGQLRFWWRALQSHTMAPAELRERETRLFGGPGRGGDDEGHASLLQIGVCSPEVSTENIDQARTEVRNDRGRRRRISHDAGCPAYGVRVLLQDEKVSIEVLKAGAAGKLNIRISSRATDDQVREVRLALLAFIFFGGLGARTRRGFGSVHSPELSTKANWDELLASFARVDASTSGDSAWPSLHRSHLFAHSAQANADTAGLWHELIQGLGGYRQTPGLGRAHGTRTPGRSYWPEADAIRTHLRFYREEHPIEHPDAWFPRAAFGLPLMIAFKQNGDIDPQGSATLYPEGAERWPSPLFLKVVTFTDAPPMKLAVWLNQRIPTLGMKWGQTPQVAAGGFIGPDDFKKRVLRAEGRRVIERGVHPIDGLVKHLNLAPLP